MFIRGSSSHVPLNAKFVIAMLLICFTLLIVCVFGLAGILPGSTGFWACSFVTSIGMAFFIAGIVSVAGNARFFFTLHKRKKLQAVIVGAKKVRLQNSSGNSSYFIYCPKLAYRFQGADCTRISNYGTTRPKWSKGDQLTLYVDEETGDVAELRDGFRGVVMGLFAILLGGGLTTFFWILYTRGLFL